MPRTKSSKWYRQRRIDGICKSCPRPRLLDPDIAVCARCRELHNARNVRPERRAQKTEWERMSRRSAGAKTIEELRDEQEEARQERVNLMFIFANRHKRLPTLREMGTMFGDESEMSWRSSSRQELRRSAFGLRKLSDLGRKHIPYPVPEEYRADDCF